jgi:hypothetical protein
VKKKTDGPNKNGAHPSEELLSPQGMDAVVLCLGRLGV